MLILHSSVCLSLPRLSPEVSNPVPVGPPSCRVQQPQLNTPEAGNQGLQDRSKLPDRFLESGLDTLPKIKRLLLTRLHTSIFKKLTSESVLFKNYLYY